MVENRLWSIPNADGMRASAPVAARRGWACSGLGTASSLPASSLVLGCVTDQHPHPRYPCRAASRLSPGCVWEMLLPGQPRTASPRARCAAHSRSVHSVDRVLDRAVAGHPPSSPTNRRRVIPVIAAARAVPVVQGLAPVLGPAHRDRLGLVEGGAPHPDPLGPAERGHSDHRRGGAAARVRRLARSLNPGSG
jgi:hypothetical protein